MRGVAVLMYHALEDADHPCGSDDPGERLYAIETQRFRQQMEYLRREGYRTLLLDELGGPLPEKSVVLTFDDGHASNATLALPILREFGFRAEFFITSGWTGKTHYLSREQLRELAGCGMALGSHGRSHALLSDLEPGKLEEELSGSRRDLEQGAEVVVRGLSAPGGRVNRTIRRLAGAAGYRYLCTSVPGLYLPRPGGLSLVPRMVVHRNTSEAEFRRIVAGDPAYYRKARMRYALLAALKLVLGNRLYVRLHRLASAS